jgi:hypothetical protein
MNNLLIAAALAALLTGPALADCNRNSTDARPCNEEPQHRRDGISKPEIFLHGAGKLRSCQVVRQGSYSQEICN